ncbi:MAG TPA: septation protein SepH [Nakamurella sp.]
MRALRVLGMAEDGENLLCEDTVTGEVFSLRTDERLRAAARGELKGSGRRVVETDPQLRPREIQARIRAGKTVAEVAAEAVTSVSRIESYAYPVMLERQNMADKARAAHPMVDGNPTRKTLEELVTATLRQRGHADGMRWDAYRPDDYGWLVAVHWHAGRSDNQATWEIHTGARTTTLRARDDAARELLDPSPRPLRTIAEASTEPAPAEAASTFDQLFGEPAPRPAAGTDTRLSEAARHPAGTRRPVEQAAAPTAPAAPTPPPATQPDPKPAVPARQPAEMTGTEPNLPPTRTARRGQRPVMPGWEDVLLGGPSKG